MIGIYLILALFVLVADRATKIYALDFLPADQVVLNRGISWGLFNNYGELVFIGISVFILCISIYLLYYACLRYGLGYNIYGETLIIAGALSNLFDRAFYGGVIDFIELYYRGWYFPSFNIADSAIVLGVFIMFIQIHRLQNNA